MRKGFTLIELLVVVLIIGILAAVALPQYRKAVEKSKATEAIVAVKALGQAEQIYKLANGNYTTDMSELDVQVPVNLSNYTMYLLEVDSVEARAQATHKTYRLFFVYYLETGTLNCQVSKSSAENSSERNLCKTFSSTKVTCLETAWDCYEIN